MNVVAADFLTVLPGEGMLALAVKKSADNSSAANSYIYKFTEMGKLKKLHEEAYIHIIFLLSGVSKFSKEK